ncbi:TIGR04076 family protein [Acetobacterium sp. UBA5834]|jgi:uncharacterized repeat protein (TIGR04076 family)|uniref:TIGR04076 family protein n=1 Tax=Acetobacterium sp. UBA5834 TaxID=1945907 RepID=UPI00257D0CFF|nr:TIGR04076 family protein [Acetobacterium sp. UBA5834]
MNEIEQKIKLVVESSDCPLYAPGDEVIFDGPQLDKDNSGNFCMMALSAVFPFVYAARKGVINEAPLQCPDCGEEVVFRIYKA